MDYTRSRPAPPRAPPRPGTVRVVCSILRWVWVLNQHRRLVSCVPCVSRGPSAGRTSPATQRVQRDDKRVQTRVGERARPRARVRGRDACLYVGLGLGAKTIARVPQCGVAYDEKTDTCCHINATGRTHRLTLGVRPIRRARAHTHTQPRHSPQTSEPARHMRHPGTPHNVLDAAAAATRALEDRDRLEASCIRGMPQVCRARRTAVILRRARPGLPAGPRPGAPPRCMGWPAKAREPPAHTARTGSAQLELRSCHRGGMRAGGVCLW